MTNPERRILDSVICSGIVKPDDAASGCGDAKSGLFDRYVLSGFACTLVLSVRNASPVYDILKMPLNLSSARSPISSISSSGGVEPRLSSVTMMSSTMMGGLGDLLSAVVSMSRARDVSAISGDQLKLNAMATGCPQCAGAVVVLLRVGRVLCGLLGLSRACLPLPRGFPCDPTRCGRSGSFAELVDATSGCELAVSRRMRACEGGEGFSGWTGYEG
jgi:hypothetical protein